MRWLRRGCWSLGRIGRIRLRTHASAIGTVALLAATVALGLLPVTARAEPVGWYWLGGAGVALAVLGSLVVHELAHAALARRHGITTRRITLWLLGCTAEQDSPPPNPRADAVIALAGPAASAVLGLGCWLLALVLEPVLAPVPLASLLWLGAANLTIGVVALLPGAPLDGGRLVRAVVWARTGDRRRAELVSARWGHALGIALLACGVAEVILFGQFVGIWLSVFGWVLLGAATLRRIDPRTEPATP